MQRDYIILSLDLGTNMGWCLIRNGVIEYSGEQFFSNKDIAEGQREIKFMNWLKDNFSGVDEVFHEDIGFTNSQYQIRSYYYFEAALAIFCCSMGITRTAITPGDWKKILTGKGRGNKKFGEDEKTRVCKRLHELGWEGGKIGTAESNNEADAIGVGIACMQKRSAPIRFKD